MRVLLHTCCGPCASHCIDELQKLGHEVTLFYSNSNIAPYGEFIKRLGAVKQLAAAMHLALLVEESDHAEWLAQVADGFEKERERGARCDRCFRYSLQRTYDALVRHGFDGFTTSLTVSPFKHSPTIFAVGRSIAPERFLAINFKKDDGYKHSMELSERLGLYRQNYCGCEFSVKI